MRPSLHRAEEKVQEMGPLEPDRGEIREEPYSLPDKFMWDEVDLLDGSQVRGRGQRWG